MFTPHNSKRPVAQIVCQIQMVCLSDEMSVIQLNDVSVVPSKTCSRVCLHENKWCHRSLNTVNVKLRTKMLNIIFFSLLLAYCVKCTSMPVLADLTPVIQCLIYFHISISSCIILYISERCFLLIQPASSCDFRVFQVKEWSAVGPHISLFISQYPHPASPTTATHPIPHHRPSLGVLL